MNGSNPYIYVLAGMTVLAVIVYMALGRIKAGYGMFRSEKWGWSVNNKLGWVLMEAPAFFAMLTFAMVALAFYGLADYKEASMRPWLGAPLFLVLLFLIHYFQRSFVFPMLMKGSSRMPIAIVLMGITFNLINTFLLALGLFTPLSMRLIGDGTHTLTAMPFGEWIGQAHAWIGVVMFFIGMGINMHSDHVIRHLRKAGDTRHYLPEKGMYRYVTSANYFGEIVEWTGFAIAAMVPEAWLFAVWTAANLVPRANDIHKRYREEFGDAVGKRKRIIPYIY